MSPDAVRLPDLAPGTEARICFIVATSVARLTKLATYGIVAGGNIRLIALRPSLVLSCGATTIAIDDEIAREIYVRREDSL